MNKTVNLTHLRDPETREKLRKWWESLEDNRGARARLRRAEHPDDVLLTEPFFQFLCQMPADWSEPANLSTSAIIAATLAHVRQSFASQLASPNKEVSDKPCMSEFRFQQLQKSRDPEEFFMRLLRAVRLADNKVNLFSLADSILHWMKEYRFGINREPQKRLAVRWANDYYVASSKAKNKS